MFTITASTMPKRAMMFTAFLRRQPNLSITPATQASKMLTALVRAANVTRTKKARPSSSPTKPSKTNTLGRLTNISPGPADIPSVPLNTYTAGIIIRPANRAITVSNISILSTD